MQTVAGPGETRPAVNERLAGQLSRFAVLLGIGAALVGAVHVGAWTLGLLEHPVPDSITMKTNAAVSLLLTGVALALVVRPRPGRIARLVVLALSVLVLLGGLLTLSENLVGWDLGIDQILAYEAPGALAVTAPNRMGTPASTSFLLAGIALLVLGRGGATRPSPRLVQGLGLAVCLIGSLGAIGHLYGAGQLFGIARYTGIAWPTAAALVAIGVGLVCARPASGIMETFVADDVGGRVLRSLLGLTVGLPLVVGYLRLLGERRGLFDAPMGTALVMLLFIVVLSAVVWQTARSLSRRETAQRTILEVVRESEDRYRQMFENMTEGFAVHEVVTDDAGAPIDYRFLDINPSFERLTGLRRTEVVGRTVREVLSGVEPFWIQTYGRVALTGEPAHFDRYYPPPLDRWYDVIAYRPAPRRFAVIFTDVTERKRAEQALRESESRFRTMGETLPYGVWLCNAEGDLEYVSQSFLDLLEMTQEEQREFGWTHRLPPEDVQPMLDRWRHCVRTGQDWDGEHRVLGPDGKYHTVLTRGKPVRDAAGNIVSWVGINLDIDDRKRMEEELRRWAATLEARVAERTADVASLASQLRELTSELTRVEHRERQRLAKVLHDHIQQLLVAAKIHTGMLMNRQPSPPLEESARLVGDLLDQALSASRSLTAELSPPVLFDAGLGPALQWLARDLLEKHGLSVEVAFDPAGEPAVEDLRVFLFDAVRELLFNTVKHAGVSRACVDIARTPDRRIRVVVSDEGKGLPPDLGEKRSESGGFGLFSIQQRLQHMGGRLEIDSAPGRGTRITLVAPEPPDTVPGLPARAVAPAASTAERIPGPDPSGEVIRVLLADDHAVMRQGLASLLAVDAGIQVVGEASDGLEAVELARRLRPDIVVMDVSMPRMNGIDATREITRELDGVKVVGLSMHEDGVLSAAMREAGAVGYATKGGSSEALVAAIRAAVQG